MAPNLLEVGRVDKPHGIRGDVVVKLTTTEIDRVAVGARLHAGDRVLLVVESRPHQHRFIVHFEGVATREGAEELAGTALCAEAPADTDPEDLWVHELIGSLVVESDGTARGTVESVQENPASDLLVLDSGALVPLRFLVERDGEGRLVVEVPVGLFDVNEP